MEDEDDVLDIGLEEELIQDARTDASMPSLFDDGLYKSEAYVKQRQATKTSSFLCTSTTAAAAPPSLPGNSSNSCILKRRRSHNKEEKESPFDRTYTRTVVIRRKKQQGFS